MKQLFFLLYLVCYSNGFSQQHYNTQIVDSINISADQFIGKDSFDNYYTITENTLQKTNSSKSFVYKNVALGKLTSVDILNPLQIVVLYKEYNTIVILDNQLSEVQKINGNNYNIIFEGCGLTIQNKLWFYDMATLKIGLFNLEDDSYKFISTPLNNTLKYCQSDYNRFYWIDDDNEFYSITFFGKIKSLGKVPTFNSAQILSETNLLYKLENQLYLLDLSKKEEIELKTDKKTFSNFCLKGEFLSIFTNNKVINYKINTP
ncbi:hypothetical protein ACFS5J_07805 [Flavobacterium chuncheonense]|uniref:Uncharacterized protein n=1 Tax=Flavobacterium chuncheonense TaxID=2026653 RepID=A0ABW5YLF2_9FLAO